MAARLADLLRQADEAGDEQLAAQCRAILSRVKAGGTIPANLLNALVLGSTRAVAEDATDRKDALRRPAAQAAPAPTPTPGLTPAPGWVGGALVDLLLLEPGAALIVLIREIRDATGLGLREVTDLVRSAPGPILTAVPKAEAEKMRRRLEAAGARIELRPHS
jgi:large subunit ribosomal protein L7/L12